MRGMTFSEIGAELGVTRQRAEQIYQSAMRKMRRRPTLFQTLLDLAAELEREKEARLTIPHIEPRTVRRRMNA